MGFLSFPNMKLSTPVLKTLLMTASISVVVPILAQTRPPARSRAEAPQEKEPEVVLPGSVLPYGDGWMSLSLDNGTFLLAFYDAEKKPIPAPFARATARWSSPLRTSEQRLVLNPSADGLSLVGNKPVRPPYTFKVYLVGVAQDESVGGSYVIDFKG